VDIIRCRYGIDVVWVMKLWVCDCSARGRSCWNGWCLRYDDTLFAILGVACTYGKILYVDSV